MWSDGSLSYMLVIHVQPVTAIVKQISDFLYKFDLWPSSWPWKKGHRQNSTIYLWSSGSLSYMLVIHVQPVTAIVKQISDVLYKSDLWPSSWPWKKGHR